MGDDGTRHHGVGPVNIVHVTPYLAEEMAYQENLLPEGQALLGHDVTIITGVNQPDFGFNSDSRRRQAGSVAYGNCTLVRLDHYWEFTNRAPVLKSLYAEIAKRRPDILFIHDVGAALVVGVWYKRRNPEVVLHFDCHSDFKNARTSWLGPAYHGFFRMLFRSCGDMFDRVFAVAPETVEFLRQVYGVPEKRITLLPLPGDASRIRESQDIRARVRTELGFAERHRLLIHTGKLPGDKLTLTVLEMFRELRGQDYRLLVAGDISQSFRGTFDSFLAADDRISYLGWVSAERLRELFMASDLLLAPGSLSNTFIDAICSGLPVLLDDTPQGRFLTGWGNGTTHPRGTHLDLLAAVKGCMDDDSLDRMRERARKAADHLDYRNIAKLSLE
jgi:glycosyltransferase involved in cell wall biosynthesis